MLIAIWAEASNGVIGKNGQLPWHFPEELAHFKRQTLGKVVVFGYRTLQGLGSRTFPGRTVVLYNEKDVPSPVKVLNYEEIVALSKTTHVVIAGGKNTYETFLPVTDKVIRTVIHEPFDGDTTAPNIDGFVLTNIEHHEQWDIETYERVAFNESI